MFVIGLTGSIAMGKSTTARLFAEAGVPVHDSDATVHRLYENEAVAAIEAAFPGTTKDGKVDRVLLGRRVLGDAAALKKLEQVVHPMVREASQRFLKEAEAAGAKVVVLDIPLERGIGAAQLEALLARQVPDVEKRARADFVVDSSQGIEHARAQVNSILTAVARMPPRRK
jgi:dephospho-CoA kinase